MRRCILLSLSLWLFFGVELSEGSEPRRVLVIHSYGRDLSWTEEVHRGIVDSFEASGIFPEFRVEYLDTKHRVGREYLDLLGKLLRMKYRGAAFDGILLADNNACDFYLRQLVPFFFDVHAVAIGYNGEMPAAPPRVHILPEKIFPEKTLDLALRQNPGARRVFALHDGTETGEALGREIAPLLADLEAGRGIPGRVLSFSSLAAAADFLRGLGAGDVVFLLSFFRDAEADRGLTPEEAAGALSTASPVPLYVSWTHYLGHGVLGGFMVSPYRVGFEGARYLQGLWQGGRSADLARAADLQNLYGADYAVMRRFGLRESDFPAGTLIVGEPPSFYERHREVLFAAAVLVAALLAVIVFLLAALGRKNRLLRHRQEIEALQKELLETQEETIALIGDAIEGRSRETANHVRRVAEVAASLGEKRGLDEREVQLLRQAAPLHDLGKIAVPDAILAKPGRLDEEEFEKAKKHAAVGADILSRSRREVLRLAAVIAGQHHERWDGEGYPEGLSGEGIHIAGRLVAVADVFDALLSRRCYKEPWPIEEVVAYFQGQRGSQFDPDLVDLLLAHLDEITAMRARFPDREP